MYLIRAGLLLGACLAASQATAAEPDPVAADEQMLMAASVSTDNASLLKFFRERTLTKESRARVATQIRYLGHASFRMREKASEDLVRTGSLAVPMLREAAANSDLEVARRAQRCLQQIDSGPSIELASAAARLLAVRKPLETAEVLLNYLPDAPDETVRDLVRTSLAAVAFQNGKTNLAVVRDLASPVAVRRAAAAEALCRAGATEQYPAARRLLQDRDPLVRLLVALALARAGDREAVPVLIALLTELPEEQTWRAEDVLLRLAGDQAPNQPLGLASEERRKVRDAWQGWWQRNRDQVNLARLADTPALLGLTTIAHWDNGQGGRIVELGPDSKPRREIQNIPWPIDFYVLPGNRMLCAEYYVNKVTERNLKGELLWEKSLPENPLAAQRLPSGNTFIVMRGEIVEVDRAGKEVAAIRPPAHDIVSAIKMRNGQISLITMSGQFKRLDAAGKELKTFSVGTVHSYAAIDVLPNGHVLVPHFDQGKVAEYDMTGKTVWEASVPQPTAPVRLPNGHTLVACRDAQLVVELDRAGKTVWTYKSTTYPWRVRRR
jgi:hypothetical protein